MSTKTKTTKPAPKKAAKIPPVRFAGVTIGGFPSSTLIFLLGIRTSKELAGLLRERGLGIPKDKTEMVARLADWFRREDGLFTLTLS